MKGHETEQEKRGKMCVCVCDGNYSVINLERLKKQRKIDSIKNNEFHGRKVRWFKKRAKKTEQIGFFYFGKKEGREKNIHLKETFHLVSQPTAF